MVLVKKKGIIFVLFVFVFFFKVSVFRVINKYYHLSLLGNFNSVDSKWMTVLYYTPYIVTFLRTQFLYGL